jgi:serine/threonine protein kinase
MYLLLAPPTPIGSVPRDSPTRFALARPGLGTFTADVLLGDFGCARELSRAPTSSAAAATAEAARGGWLALRYDHAGTLYFTPPEALDEQVIATSGDVWAAGCVAFSLLHRRPPFAYDGESEEMTRLRILRAEPLYAPPPAASLQRQQHQQHQQAAKPSSAVFPMAEPLAGSIGGANAAGANAANATNAPANAAAHAGGIRPGMDGKPLAPLSDSARGFLKASLLREWRQRPSAEEALRDPWIASSNARQPMGGAGAGSTALSGGAPPQAPAAQAPPQPTGGGSSSIGPTPAFGSFHVQWE